MGRRGRSKGDSSLSGIALVDKEGGWTSHDVVAKARGLLGTSKVGHSGTLDPDATGLLVLGVGKGTKLLRFLQVLPKTYESTFRFGVETDTLDAAGEVTATHEMDLDPDAVAEAARAFVGDIEQVPPMVSAVKIDGVRLHELARAGKTVDRPPRPVTVYRFDIEPTEDPLEYRTVIECSSGTYIRVLAADLGHRLGGGAHVAALRRTSVGGFSVEESTTLENITLLDLPEGVRGFPSCRVDGEVEARIRVGAVLGREVLDVAGEGPWPVMSAETDTLLAIYEPHGADTVKPAVVLV